MPIHMLGSGEQHAMPCHHALAQALGRHDDAAGILCTVIQTR
jgi:hypothetical protein